MKLSELKDISVKFKGPKGDPGKDGAPGYTPIKGVDYFTPREIRNVIEVATPKRGVDYFTESDIDSFKAAATPIKGVDYHEGSSGKDGKDGKSIIGPRGPAGEPGRNGSPDTPEQIIGKIQSYPGKHWLDVSAISGLTTPMGKRTIHRGGGDGGPTGSGTINELTYWATATTLGSLTTATYPSLTELSYVKGVTSAIQTQLDTKAPTASPTFTGTVTLPVGLTGIIRADSGVVSVDTDITDLVVAASDTVAGKVELATDAETVTGTDTTRATTPANITAKMAAPGTIGGTTPGAATFTTVGGTTITASTGFALDDGDYVGITSNERLVFNTAGTIAVTGANLDLGLNSIIDAKIDYRIEPSADDTFQGEMTNDKNAGATIAQWELVYGDTTAGEWLLADADAAASAGGVPLALAAEAGTDGNPMNVVLRGIVRNDGWTWSGAFKTLYVSTTAGGMTETAPSAADDVVRVVGYTLSDDAIYFNPSNDWITHV